MASVREKAAALRLEQKLCVRPQAHGMVMKPAESTSMWSNLVSYLKSSVKVKHRRVHLKSHSDCFLGSEAVDVLADYISQIKSLEAATVSRDRVMCVCQALLDCKVFEAVGTHVFGKDKKRDVFKDSKSALYRFSNTHTPSVDQLEKGVLSQGIQKFFCSLPSDRKEEQECPHGAPVQPFNSVRSNQTCPPVKVNQPEPAIKVEQLLETGIENLSQSPSTAQAVSVLPQSSIDEIWREQTVLKLLRLVELPLLEGVLQCNQCPCSHSPQPHLSVQSNPHLIYSSNCLDRQVLKTFRDSQDDAWLCAALDCLDFLSDQPVVELSREMSKCSDGLTQCKLLLYGTLNKHYNHAGRPPLLPQHMTDVYTAITDLLVNAKWDKALEALQLCLKLLRKSSREELRRLLTFMDLAADPHEIKLDKEMENRLVLKRSFCRAILPSRALSKEREDLMMVFMLSNLQEIFKIPGALHKVVSDKLASIAQGKQPDVTGSSFHQQVSNRIYADSMKKTTNKELWLLLDNIHLDSKISGKEKRRLLGQFYKAHTEIFLQYFGGSALDVL
ncbi:DEP domain-containing protein 7-like [Lampris incognitus]|uniref:DEP domain-containing protein 7-like n=1 Tax=Lampris incognitus TaxID=2546036 RepID=UPI0024B5F43B|nr:DEP domain-containing protein 7-like [Lampris incognitus]